VTDQSSLKERSGLNDPLPLNLRPHTVIYMEGTAMMAASYSAIAVAGALSIPPAKTQYGSWVRPIDLLWFDFRGNAFPGKREDLS
jgi:hypothetical protein